MVKKFHWKVPLRFYYNYKFRSIWLCCDNTEFGLSLTQASHYLFGQILCRAGSEITLIGPVTVTNLNT
jgi:hypothetical protein